MKIYLDTNIILDMLFQRANTELTRYYIKENLKNDILVTNNLSLNNIFYIAVEKFKEYENIKELFKYIENSSKWEIYNLTRKDRLFCYDYMDKNIGADFEDLQQYISAKNNSCKAIITNDKNFPKLDPLIRTNLDIENYTPKI